MGGGWGGVVLKCFLPKNKIVIFVWYGGWGRVYGGVKRSPF